MTIITINLSPTLDAELRRPRSPSAAAGGSAFHEFHELIAEQRLRPLPLFPDVHVIGFAPIWHVSVPEHEAATIVARLAQTSGVEAAYSKPNDELASPP